ncbi:hypothetical protein ACW5WG_21400, partial [Aeromonas salmonicida]
MRNNSHQFFSRHSFVRGRFNYAMMFFLAALIATLLPQGESVNVLLTGSQFLDASSQDSFQIFTAHA